MALDSRRKRKCKEEEPLGLEGVFYLFVFIGILSYVIFLLYFNL